MSKCILCGREVVENKNGYRNFCSNTCYGRYYREKRYGIKKCKWCGRQFISERGKFKAYCCQSHYWKDLIMTERTYEADALLYDNEDADYKMGIRLG